MWCKLLVKTPSEYTYSLFWAELSRLLGEKIPVAIVGLEPGTPGVEYYKVYNTSMLVSQSVDTWIHSESIFLSYLTAFVSYLIMCCYIPQ